MITTCVVITRKRCACRVLCISISSAIARHYHYDAGAICSGPNVANAATHSHAHCMSAEEHFPSIRPPHSYRILRELPCAHSESFGEPSGALGSLESLRPKEGSFRRALNILGELSIVLRSFGELLGAGELSGASRKLYV